MSLQGKVALVSDLNGTFGQAIVNALVGAGAKVRVGVQPVAKVSPLPAGVVSFVHEPWNQSSWDRALSMGHEDAPVDIIVINPDGLINGSIASLETEGWRAAYKALLEPIMIGMRQGIPWLKNRKGARIVSIASIASEIGLAEYVSYSACAFSIRSMTRSAAIHCLEKNYELRMGCVVAGFQEGTDLGDRIPLAAVKGEHVGAAVAYLCSDAGAASTGSELIVDGGGNAWPG